MNDRWLRAEERLRRSTEERRYRRSDNWAETDDRAAHSAQNRAVRGSELGAPRGAEPRPGRRARHAAPDEWDEREDDTTIIPAYRDEYEDGYPSGEFAYGADQAYTGGHRYVDPDGYGEPEYAQNEYAEDYYDQEPLPEPEPEPRRAPQRSGPRGRGAREETARSRSGARTGREQTGGKQAARKSGARGAGAGTQRSRKQGSRDEPPRGRSGRGRRSRVASRKAAERKRRRRNLVYVGTVFVVLFAVAVVYAGYKFLGGFAGPDDYTGAAGPLTVVRVAPGDTAEQISKTMVDKGVVKSSGAFYQAAVRDSGMNSVQPGYYAVPTHSKGADAVTAMMSKDARVGNVVISEGRRLHDSTDANTGSRSDGIYRKIADASCLGSGSEKKCVSYEQLDAAGASTDLNALGVPQWAMDSVRQVPDRTRQLEGLIEAGTWDFDPSGTPQQILAQLVRQSAQSYESTGLLTSNANGLNPYQTLTAASLVEREALPADMPRVARVIVNRLAVNQPLQFDSTVNYTLDKLAVATSDSDRAKRTPWNTYAMSGLPATPIASPSLGALRAMENPTPGPWLYFVTVDKQGTTLFTDSYSEHQRNIEKARQSGILDSGH
ncbi:endolytic transglycosylase MltG [Nocardia sp. CA2R105]|uniref:endolytic transglycosylase MltG n=1 Tax=Nocardia coffeae TaxID=2873381 RepID=UPI001CA6873E|nr:endolytic transglycosylase MltG [Nocardia coffeae]MBY8859558.1 endolytic transglycosylase MltG [Nocardia coffeae]